MNSEPTRPTPTTATLILGEGDMGCWTWGNLKAYLCEIYCVIDVLNPDFDEIRR